MKEIILTQGKVALVDDEDFEYLSKWKWHTYHSYELLYATRTSGIYMHRIIMKTPSNLQVDHKDHNGLNNQKSNLRNCTHTENSQNRKTISNSKGIYYLGNVAGYRTCICVNKKIVYLGRYHNKVDAMKAYNIAALKYFGGFARLNTIPLEKSTLLSIQT